MRASDWEQRLADYIGERREAVFAWGVCDCALFAAGAVLAMTSTDPAAEVRGRYRTKTGAARVLHGLGYHGLDEFMAARFATIPPGKAMRGDVVMADGALGVCLGREAAFVGNEDGREGLVMLPLRQWQAAWRVPFAGQEG